MGYFHVLRALLGVFELTIICDCYDLDSNVSGFTISMCLKIFGSSMLSVWFKLIDVLFSDVMLNMNYVI